MLPISTIADRVQQVLDALTSGNTSQNTGNWAVRDSKARTVDSYIRRMRRHILVRLVGTNCRWGLKSSFLV